MSFDRIINNHSVDFGCVDDLMDLDGSVGILWLIYMHIEAFCAPQSIAGSSLLVPVARMNSREYSKHLKFHVNMLATNFFPTHTLPKGKKLTVRRRCRCPLRFSQSPTKYGESISVAWREHTAVSVTGGWRGRVAMLSIRRAAALQFMGLRLVLLARDDVTTNNALSAA